MRRVFCFLFLGSLFCCFTWRLARAPQHLDAYGRWRSTTGERYRVVSTSGRSELEIISPVGVSRACRARWLQEGQAFAFSEAEGEGMVVATYRREHDALELKEPQGTSWLRREGAFQSGTPVSSR